MAELLGFPPETRAQGGARLTYMADSSPQLPSAQDDTILAATADSVVISNMLAAPGAPHIHHKSVAQAQINDLVLSKERERCRSDLPSEEVSGLMAASRVCRLELGEARDREYLQQCSGYETRFGSGLSQVKRELDQQQAALASGGTARPLKLRLSRLGERGGHEGALHAADARRELVELGRQESARKFLQWQELGKRSRLQPRNGKFSPRELQKLSPRYGRPGHEFVPAPSLRAEFSGHLSDGRFLDLLPADSPRRLPPLPTNRKAATQSTLSSDASWGPRWAPTSMVMTRLAMPGGPAAQEHMYVKRSPRLMYALPDDDPALSHARIMNREGRLR